MAKQRGNRHEAQRNNKLKGKLIVTASITNEAADELKVAVGQTTYAVIKASDLMVGID